MIIANMATFPARADTLEQAVRAMAAQVDKINLCLNEYSEIPAWAASISNLNAVIPESDLKDLGKFMFTHGNEDDVFLVDDDIDYPRDYVAETLRERDAVEARIGRYLVVGYHGTIYLRRRKPAKFIKDVLKGRFSNAYQIGHARIVHVYYERLDRPRVMAQLGTGTVCTRGKFMPPLAFMMGAARRADVRFASWCLDQRLSMVALPRAEGWIPATVNDDVSIYRTYTAKLPDEFVAEVASFAFRVPQRGAYL